MLENQEINQDELNHFGTGMEESPKDQDDIADSTNNLDTQEDDDKDKDDDGPHDSNKDDGPQEDQQGAVFSGPGVRSDPKLVTPPLLTAAQKERVEKAKKYAMEENIKVALLRQTLIHQKQVATYNSSFQKPILKGNVQVSDQVWTKIGTIYIGSINFDVREDTVRTAFQPFGAIKNVMISWDAVLNKHKGFCFVEFELPEAAIMAIEQMNGVLLNGRNLKVGRPTNMPQSQPMALKLMEETMQYNRIYIASVHPDLSETDVQSVFEAFGKIRFCKLTQDMLRPGKHRGFGFIEYETRQSSDDAINSMNLFNLGGQYLRVGKAVTPPSVQQIQHIPQFPAAMPTAAAVAAATVTAQIAAMNALQIPTIIPRSIASPVVNQIKLAAINTTITEGKRPASANSALGPHQVPKKIKVVEESKVVLLKNMVTIDDIDEDLESEIVEECEKYGAVSRVVIYEEKSDTDGSVDVKIFVEFREFAGSKEAVESLHGRFFAGRKVQASIYPQTKFDSQDLSG